MGITPKDDINRFVKAFEKVSGEELEYLPQEQKYIRKTKGEK